MVSTEDNPVAFEPNPVGQAQDLVAKLSRCQTGVAAFVIDLVAGGFDERGTAVMGGLAQGSL